MTDYRIIKIPAPLVGLIDTLVKSGEFSSRSGYVKNVIWKDLQSRGLLGGSE